MSAQPKTPKPAQGSADAHRDGKETVGGSDDDDEPDQDLADVPGGGTGGFGGGGGGGGLPGGGGGGGGGGIDLGINVRTIALGAGLAIAAYLAYKTFVDTGGVTNRSPTTEPSDDGGEEAAEAEEDATPNIPNDPQDPLKADDAAGEAIFDGWGE